MAGIRPVPYQGTYNPVDEPVVSPPPPPDVVSGWEEEQNFRPRKRKRLRITQLVVVKETAAVSLIFEELSYQAPRVKSLKPKRREVESGDIFAPVSPPPPPVAPEGWQTEDTWKPRERRVLISEAELYFPVPPPIPPGGWEEQQSWKSQRHEIQNVEVQLLVPAVVSPQGWQTEDTWKPRRRKIKIGEVQLFSPISPPPPPPLPEGWQVEQVWKARGRPSRIPEEGLLLQVPPPAPPPPIPPGGWECEPSVLVRPRRIKRGGQVVSYDDSWMFVSSGVAPASVARWYTTM